jgi:NADH dehydrogenase (ubiquinone) 1 alpha subcomplex subunit 5
MDAIAVERDVTLTEIRATLNLGHGQSTTIQMFRLTRPLFQQVLKRTTGVTGIPVHPNPLPELSQTYEATLSLASTIPATSVYRQSVEALTQNKLKIVQDAKGDIAAVEKQLDEGQIEEALHVAKDELKLVSNMIEWKASVQILDRLLAVADSSCSWEPLEERPGPGQWEYFGKTSGSL